MKKESYSLLKKDGKNVIRMNTERGIGLFWAIYTESYAEHLLTPNSQARLLPQRLIRTRKAISYMDADRRVVDLPAGSYVAAYLTPESEQIKGLYYVACIGEKEVEQIRKTAQKAGVPFGAKARPDLFGLPTLIVPEMSFNGLLASGKARLIYSSPTKKTPLMKIIEILPTKGKNTVSLPVKDSKGKEQIYNQHVYAGQILALAKRSEDSFCRLCWIMPEDCRSLIAQDRLACYRLGIKTKTMSAISRVQRILTYNSKTKAVKEKANNREKN